MYGRLIILLSILLLVGCSRWGGSNPVGVTGGMDSGYEEGSLEQTNPIDHSQELIGTWEGEYRDEVTVRTVLQFTLDYRVYRELYFNNEFDRSEYGTYSIDGNELILYFEYETREYIFTVHDNKLYLTSMNGAGTILLNRKEDL